ncbi:hypothetical protein HWI79_313 [Cryptosporidium felis]|nr:hypothetical protein HWI79_313 [Cryptosporidium felis]
MNSRIITLLCISILLETVNYSPSFDLTISNSFIKLKASYNLRDGQNGDGDDGVSPQLLSLKINSSPPPSPGGRPRSRPPVRTPGGPRRRMPSWPPVRTQTQRMRLSESNANGEDEVDGVYYATKVMVRDYDPENGVDSDSDTDQSPPSSPVPMKMAVSFIPKTSPEMITKFRDRRERAERRLESKIRRGNLSALLRNPNLYTHLLFLNLETFIQFLLLYFDKRGGGMPSLTNPQRIQSLSYPVGAGPSGSVPFTQSMVWINSQVSSLRDNLRGEFASKYGVECSLELLSQLSREIRNTYMEISRLEKEFTLVSDPTKGKVDNRGLKIQNFYKSLKDIKAKERSLVTQFLDCYMGYFEGPQHPDSRKTRREMCTLADLLLLQFFLTLLRGLLRIHNGVLAPLRATTQRLDQLSEKPVLTKEETREKEDLGVKLLGYTELRVENELVGALEDLVQKFMAFCSAYLKWGEDDVTRL